LIFTVSCIITGASFVVWLALEIFLEMANRDGSRFTDITNVCDWTVKLGVGAVFGLMSGKGG
jgi:hypothetical protein